MRLSGKTDVVGIFGDPVEHSLSPCMQNAAIQAAGLDAVYVPFHVTPAQLSDAVAAIRALGLRGVNVTIPHKEAACHLVDELDQEARLIGAINTIVNQRGLLKGYNTDGAGLLKALKLELDVDVRGLDVLLLGAGGACRAALVALCRAGAGSVAIANRTRERSSRLIESLSPVFQGTTLAEYELSSALAGALPARVDLLINTTAVGLNGDRFDFCVNECIKPGGALFDMVYNVEPTALVHTARQGGLLAADGLGMLAAQGELAFQYWFDQRPAEAVMRRTLDQFV